MTLRSSEHLRRLYGFLIIMVIFWILSGLAHYSFGGYLGAFMELNQYKNPLYSWASLYFLTHLGDGFIMIPLFLLLFWKKNPGLALTAILGMLLAGMMAQSLKYFIFPTWNRPATVFQYMPCIPIYHPEPARFQSFPSGHAAMFAAAGVFYAWMLAEWKKWLPFLVGIFTVMLCYTRVVLGVHFPGDIWVGSMIGVTASVVLLWTLYPSARRMMERVPEASMKKLTIFLLILAPLLAIAQYFKLLYKIIT